MAENLNFHRGIAADIADLVPSQLPAEHHPAHAHGGAEQHPGQGMHRELGGAVDGDFGGNLAAKLRHAQILYDKGVHAGGGRLPDQRADVADFPVGHQSI